MHKLIREFEQAQLRDDVPDFKAGDTVRVSVRIREGDKSRLQDFQGVCIARDGSGMSETFTLRRVSYGVGMERVFPLQSPRVEKITVVRQGRVRRAKLYYLRNLRGKKARIQEARRPSLKVALNTKPVAQRIEAAQPPAENSQAPAPEAAAEQPAVAEASAEPKNEE